MVERFKSQLLDGVADYSAADGIRVAGPAISYAIEDIPRITGIPRTKVFDAVKNEEVTARKAGRSTLIEHVELLRWIRSLPIRGRQPTAHEAA